jgi:hypothetical protein
MKTQSMEDLLDGTHSVTKKDDLGNVPSLSKEVDEVWDDEDPLFAAGSNMLNPTYLNERTTSLFRGFFQLLDSTALTIKKAVISST